MHRFPAGCSTWACAWCGPLKARRKAELMAWAKPERFVTLTQAPGEWQACRAKVRKLALKLRTDGYSVEWAWVVERGSKTGMVHVHALQHGDFIPQRRLQAAWGSIVHLERVHDVDGAVRYTTKHAARRVASYTMKGTASELSAHLALNGGRGVHMSRRYLRGETSRSAWALLHPPGALKWCQVPVWMADADAIGVASTAG